MDDFPLEATLGTIFPHFDDHLKDDFDGWLALQNMTQQISLGGLAGRSVAPDGTFADCLTSMSATVIYSEIQNSCPALQQGGECGIYERRPSVCRYVPAQHLVPFDRQLPMLQYFKEA